MKQSLNITSIPIEGNTYLITDRRSRNVDAAISNGISGWHDSELKYSSWFKVSGTGDLYVSIRAQALKGEVSLKIAVDNHSPQTIIIKSRSWSVIPVTSVRIDRSKYVRVNMELIDRKDNSSCNISDIMITGQAAQKPLFFVRDFSTYWGMRGPSVHMRYKLPENENIEWFYNELTVPEGNDVVGSCYMANSFNGGYFGMQVNIEEERRILFSVWSPYTTNNPQEIPEEYQVKTLSHGEGVHVGEFGNEGAGGQSYMKYRWKPGMIYKFLTRIYPDGKGNTIFTSYFFATEVDKWMLIASFLRPKTDIWYQEAHSFLENFMPEQGYLTRKVYFGNQWAVTNKGKWMPVTQGRFTYDNTARAGVRKDYKGGMENNCFFLQNCGFFDDETELHTIFQRIVESNIRPEIDLIKLPVK